MAKANPEEVDKLRVFFQELQEKIDDPDKDYYSLGEWVENNFPEWERTVYGYSVMFENACDPSLSYLEWKPELKQFIEAQQKQAE